MIIGVNIDDKEMRKDPKFYKNFLNKINKYYPSLQIIELTFSAFLWTKNFSHNEFKETVKILLDFPFKYTIHYNDLISNYDERLFELSLGFSNKIKAEKIITHSINENIHPIKLGREFYFSKEREKIDLRQKSKELNILKKVLLRLQNYRMSLSIENALPKIDTTSYSYSINPINLISQIQELKLDNIKLCFDWGHAFIACEYFGWNLQTVIKEVVSYVDHMHIHNNFGILKEPNNLKNLHANGDLHFPIYKGLIDYNSFKNLFNNFKGIFLFEYTFSNCNNILDSIKLSLDFINKPMWGFGI